MTDSESLSDSPPPAKDRPENEGDISTEHSGAGYGNHAEQSEDDAIDQQTNGDVASTTK